MDLQTFTSYRAATAGSQQAKRLENALVDAEKALIENCARKLDNGDMDDLMQAGRIGVLRALRKFDPARGAWSPYARQWIFAEMNRGVVEARPQVHMKARWSKAMLSKATRRRANAISVCAGRRATAEELGISEERLEAGRFRHAAIFSYEEGVPDDGAPLDPGVLLSIISHPDGCTGAARSETILSKGFWRAFGSLSAVESRVILKRVLDEKTFPEISESEGGYEATWARRMFDEAMLKLKTMLEPASP